MLQKQIQNTAMKCEEKGKGYVQRDSPHQFYSTLYLKSTFLKLYL